MIFSPNIVIQDTIHKRKLLSKKRCVQWLSLLENQNISLTIRIICEEESQSLNYKYRKVNKPTNILSFLIDNNPLVGDLVLCHPIIKQEARIQKKKIEDHYTHLLIHGYLHLLGFNHEKKQDALIMEKREINVLRKLGIKNPYKSNIIK